MSSVPVNRRREALDTLVGLMSAAAIFVGLLAAWNIETSLEGTEISARPIKAGIGALAVALLAASIGGRHQRLAQVAVGLTSLFWFAGMVIAVVTEKPLF